jgi:hypothetical protein
MMRVYELSSTSGAMVAFAVFLLFSLGLSMVLYAVLVRPSSRRAPFHDEPAVRASLAALTSTIVFGILFGALYVTTLRGFYRVELRDNEVRLHYLFPAHTVTLHRIELAQAERVSTHKGCWHLRLHTRQGTTYQSALANDRAVLESWEGLTAYLGGTGGP